MFQEAQHRFIGDKVKIVIHKNVLLAGPHSVPWDSQIPLKLLFRGRKAQPPELGRRFPADRRYGGDKIFPKMLACIILLGKLHPTGKDAAVPYQGINRMGLTVSRAGYNRDQRALDCPFKKPIDTGPLQKSLAFRSHGGKTVK
jgi:hypothetical protein